MEQKNRPPKWATHRLDHPNFEVTGWWAEGRYQIGPKWETRKGINSKEEWQELGWKFEKVKPLRLENK